MFFASDNWAGVAPQINDALAHFNTGNMPAYGTSDLDRKVEARLKELFECDLSVFFVATGTAANSLAIAATSVAGGIALCHSEAHVIEDECGAPEFYSGGRLAAVGGDLGKILPANLNAALGKFVPGFVHHGRPTLVTLTQSTEIGTVYTPDEIAQISKIAKSRGLAVHMDGARFANALVSLGTTPAQMTWKSGVDLVSFGGTKNGCWCAEALISFDKSRDETISFLRKRAGQLFSKSRFIAAQFDAYLGDDLWLKLAGHANEMARRLAAGISSSGAARLAWQPQSNEVFAVMNVAKAKALREKGAAFYEWNLPLAHPDIVSEGEDLFRFVTSFSTTEAEVDQFLGALAELG